MSIENNLERIAAALEAIAASMKADDDTLYVAKQPEPKPKKAPKVDAPPAPVMAPPAPIAAPAAPVAVAPGESVSFAGGVLTNPAPMTAEALNAALVAEVGRLGSPDGISSTIREMGYSGIRDMPASLYQELLNRVKAL